MGILGFMVWFLSVLLELVCFEYEFDLILSFIGLLIGIFIYVQVYQERRSGVLWCMFDDNKELKRIKEIFF